MTDETYTHDPDAFDDRGQRVEADVDGTTAADSDDGLDQRQGWLVVGLVTLCFVVLPVLVYLRPPAFLGFKDAYMVAAMVPGLLLGLIGLWAVAKGRG